MNKTGNINPNQGTTSKRGTPTLNAAQGDGMQSKQKVLKATASHPGMQFDGGISAPDAGGKKQSNS